MIKFSGHITANKIKRSWCHLMMFSICVATTMFYPSLCNSQTLSLCDYHSNKTYSTQYNNQSTNGCYTGTPTIKYRKPTLANYKTISEPKQYRMSVRTSLRSNFNSTTRHTYPSRVRRSSSFIPDPDPNNPADPLPSNPFIDDPDPDNPADPLPSNPFIDDPDPNTPADPLTDTPIGDFPYQLIVIMLFLIVFFRKNRILAHLL